MEYRTLNKLVKLQLICFSVTYVISQKILKLLTNAVNIIRLRLHSEIYLHFSDAFIRVYFTIKVKHKSNMINYATVNY